MIFLTFRLFHGSGYGKTTGHSQEKQYGLSRKRLVRSGLAQQISHKDLANELTKELKYQVSTNYHRNILLDKLLDISNGGRNVRFPNDWIASKGIWRTMDQPATDYEKDYSFKKEHDTLPVVRPTMCYGDSGGPMYKWKKSQKKLRSVIKTCLSTWHTMHCSIFRNRLLFL